MRERESWTKTERSSRRICYAWGMSELSNSNQTLLLLQLISQNFLLDTSSNQWQVACCLALAWEWDDDSQNVAFIMQSHLADMKTSCGHINSYQDPKCCLLNLTSWEHTVEMKSWPYLQGFVLRRFVDLFCVHVYSLGIVSSSSSSSSSS